MPNLGLHIHFATDAAELIGSPHLDAALGPFLLGSTTPDIRMMLGWDRKRTHFFHLTRDGKGKGVEGLLEAHPELREAGKLNKETRSFIAGYMSHLVTDEHWIVDVYRRHFGAAESALARHGMKNVIDRALQFEMDRREQESIRDLPGVVEVLREAHRGVMVGFISEDQLLQWRDVVLSRTSREFSWQHFRGFVRRCLGPGRQVTDEEIDEVIEFVPRLLDEAYRHIPAEELAAFRRASIQEVARAVGDYLS